MRSVPTFVISSRYRVPRRQKSGSIWSSRVAPLRDSFTGSVAEANLSLVEHRAHGASAVIEIWKQPDDHVERQLTSEQLIEDLEL
jgi:hypothetical protein